GNITVRLGATARRERTPAQTPYLVITVMAFTDSTPSRQAFSVVLVTLTDVNDNSPQFAAPSYTFCRSSKSPLRLPFSVGFRVSPATQMRGSNAAVFFAILGDTSGLFEVDSGTGRSRRWWRLTAGRPFGRPQSRRCPAGGCQRQSPSLPTLVSANVTEGLPADTLVTMVTASDPDIGLNATVGFRLIQTEVPPMFYLQPDARRQRLREDPGQAGLRQEPLQPHPDSLRPGNRRCRPPATLSATVQRLDRSVPRFDSTFYNASLPDNLLRVRRCSTSPPAPPGVAFNYSLGSSWNANGAFVINSRAGPETQSATKPQQRCPAVAAGPQPPRAKGPSFPRPGSASTCATRTAAPALPEAGTLIYDFTTTRRARWAAPVQYSIDNLLDWLPVPGRVRAGRRQRTAVPEGQPRQGERAHNYSLVVKQRRCRCPSQRAQGGGRRLAAPTPTPQFDIALTNEPHRSLYADSVSGQLRTKGQTSRKSSLSSAFASLATFHGIDGVLFAVGRRRRQRLTTRTTNGDTAAGVDGERRTELGRGGLIVLRGCCFSWPSWCCIVVLCCCASGRRSGASGFPGRRRGPRRHASALPVLKGTNDPRRAAAAPGPLAASSAGQTIQRNRDLR
uniref:Cadherin domain-containing protein n=1 Tax=Macrostomum lignano TaxID=282301 RepID=A0A1I8FRX2_9PLAT